MATYERILEKRINELGLIYSDVMSQVRKQLDQAKTFDYAEKQIILQDVTKSLETLHIKATRWTEKYIRNEYKASSRDVGKFLKSVDAPFKYNFNQLDEEAIRALLDETDHLLREGTAGVQRSVTRILDKATNLRVKYKILEGRISGETMKTIRNNIAGEIARGGISLVDRAGRKWDTQKYAEMVARTQAIKSANEGLANQMLKNGNDLVQVTDHDGECELCRPFERKILSLTGKTKYYKGVRVMTVEEAKAKGLFHPNCKHRYVPFHPEFAEVTKVWSEGRYQVPESNA